MLEGSVVPAVVLDWSVVPAVVLESSVIVDVSVKTVEIEVVESGSEVNVVFSVGGVEVD